MIRILVAGKNYNSSGKLIVPEDFVNFRGFIKKKLLQLENSIRGIVKNAKKTFILNENIIILSVDSKEKKAIAIPPSKHYLAAIDDVPMVKEIVTIRGDSIIGSESAIVEYYYIGRNERSVTTIIERAGFTGSLAIDITGINGGAQVVFVEQMSNPKYDGRETGWIRALVTRRFAITPEIIEERTNSEPKNKTFDEFFEKNIAKQYNDNNLDEVYKYHFIEFNYNGEYYPSILKFTKENIINPESFNVEISKIHTIEWKKGVLNKSTKEIFFRKEDFESKEIRDYFEFEVEDQRFTSLVRFIYSRKLKVSSLVKSIINDFENNGIGNIRSYNSAIENTLLIKDINKIIDEIEKT